MLYRGRESAQAGQRVALDQVVEWAHSVGASLDGLAGEERRELLDLLLEDATIDGENRIALTLAIPADGKLVPIAEPEPSYRSSNPHQTLRYSWGVSLPSPPVAARRTRQGGTGGQEEQPTRAL
ncbi:MAG: hypothetical protein OXI18_04995 [bacterium]|nr:hypothetical protein [bacterium]